ncbi:MAG: GumC family protein [Chitinispirillaceae bacterium]
MEEQKKTLKDLDILFYVTKYLNLFWRWRWFIVIAGPVITLGAVVYVFKFASPKPELPATIVVGFEKSSAEDVFFAQDPMDISKMELMKSRTLLSEVVKKLSLTMVLHKDIARSSVFDSVFTDTTAVVGKYEFEIEELEGKKYTVFFTNKRAGIERRVVQSGLLPNLSQLTLQGTRLDFAPRFLKEPYDFTFSIVRTRDAVDMLTENLVLPRVNRNSMGADFAYVSLLGRDYELLTETINTIGDEFVKRNLNFKKRKTSEVIQTLEKQLSTATRQLRKADSAVQAFMRRNPQVGLGVDTRSVLESMTQIESSNFMTSVSGEEAKDIRKRLRKATGENRELLINEALIFLSNQGSSAAMALNEELKSAKQRRASMELNYSQDHPLYREAEKKITSAGENVEKLLLEYEAKQDSKIGQQRDQMGEYSRKIQGLPLKERQLAELERRRQVTSQIHSTVLGRYNQAKIADAVEVADVYIMDYAIPPEAPPDFMNKLQMLAIGLAVAFGFSFGVPVAFDMLDKTARSEEELQRVCGYPVLESIPVIKNTKEDKQSGKSKRRGEAVPDIDPKLITAGVANGVADEFFRMLRSKIFMRLDECERKSLIVTSYDSGDGKSLIAANLAVVTAQQGLTTLLIDGDVRRGVLHKTFLLEKKPGLSSILSSDKPLSGRLLTEHIQQTHVPNLQVLTTGSNPFNPSELLSSRRFQQLMEGLYTVYDFIVIDTPPLAAVADAAIIGKLFTGYLLVSRSGATNNVALRKKVHEYPYLMNRVVGMVLNQAHLEPKLRYSRYSSYVQS